MDDQKKISVNDDEIVALISFCNDKLQKKLNQKDELNQQIEELKLKINWYNSLLDKILKNITVINYSNNEGYNVEWTLHNKILHVFYIYKKVMSASQIGEKISQLDPKLAKMDRNSLNTQISAYLGPKVKDSSNDKIFERTKTRPFLYGLKDWFEFGKFKNEFRPNFLFNDKTINEKNIL